MAEGKNAENSPPLEDNNKRIKNIKTVYDADPLKWHVKVEEIDSDQQKKCLTFILRKTATVIPGSGMKSTIHVTAGM